MRQYHKDQLTKFYQNRQLLWIEPVNQWCYFIFESNNEKFGAAFAKLEFDETATGLVATNDDFYLILSLNIIFEYWYNDDKDKGIYVCYAEGKLK